MEIQKTKKRGKLLSKLEKMYMSLSAAMLSGIMCAVSASAVDDSKAKDAMGNLMGVISTVSMYVGIGLLAFGAYEIIMSVIQSQPEAKTKGITLAVVGAILIGFKAILEGVLSGTGVSVK